MALLSVAAPPVMTESPLSASVSPWSHGAGPSVTSPSTSPMPAGSCCHAFSPSPPGSTSPEAPPEVRPATPAATPAGPVVLRLARCARGLSPDAPLRDHPSATPPGPAPARRRPLLHVETPLPGARRLPADPVFDGRASWLFPCSSGTRPTPGRRAERPFREPGYADDSGHRRGLAGTSSRSARNGFRRRRHDHGLLEHRGALPFEAGSQGDESGAARVQNLSAGLPLVVSTKETR